MPDLKERTLDFLNIEWGSYVKRFDRWDKKEGEQRVKDQGYERFRDMLAHILAWREEGAPIILAIAENREFEKKKYDFAAFNASAVGKYKDWDEAKFLDHFEQLRKKTAADLKAMNDAAWNDKKIRGWVDGIFIEHAREHCVALSRFLTLDTLENGWATYIADIEKIEDKDAFVKKQGVESVHDLIAHVIGWWEEGARIVKGIVYQPGFTWTDPTTDKFNIELTKKYRSWKYEDLLKHYEITRLELIDLVKNLPEEAFSNKDVEGWLAADVVGHYDGHLPK